MEKRNFVTSVRTPGEGTADIDDIVCAGVEALGMRKSAASRDRKDEADYERRASAEDEKSDENTL